MTGTTSQKGNGRSKQNWLASAGADSAERRLFEARRILDQDALDAALADAQAVDRPRPPFAIAAGHEPLTGVVAYLAEFCSTRSDNSCERTGNTIAAPLFANEEARDENAEGSRLRSARRLESLLERADLAGRPVLLERSWWQTMRIPAIVWTVGGAPQAFIPTGRTGGHIYDPVSGQSTIINAQVADGIAENAHAVQPTFHNRPVGFLDLLKIGFSGAGRDLVFLTLFGAAGALIGLLTPTITATLVNTAIPESDQRTVMELSIVLVCVAIAVGMFKFLEATAVLRLETMFETKAQPAIWHRLLRLPTEFFRRFESGNLTQRLMGISQIRMLLSQGVATAVLGGVFAVLNFIVMLYYGGSLTWVAVGVTVFTFCVTVAVNVVKIRRLRRSVSAMDDLAGISLQGLAMIEKLRVANAERRVLAKILRFLAAGRRQDYSARMADNVLRTFTTVIPVLSTGLFIAVVGLVYDAPPLTGNFVAFTAAFGTYIVGVTGLLNSLSAAMAGVVLFERMQPILEEIPEKASSAGEAPELSGRIDFNHVTYRYRPDAPPALRDVTLEVKQGQFAAIVGPSGSGKSTLIRMLLGFEEPTDGNVLFDGRDLAHLSKAAVRNQCGVVLQNNRMLGGSIHQSIAGSKPLTRDETWAAAEKVGLADTIRAMPMGMDTIVSSERTISGGERQRLMLARALAGEPSILILDEATSALDNVTQAGVAKTLAELDVTRIVVAHRLSTIIDADIVFVLDDGKLVEVGSVEELLKANGAFARMAARQSL
ncbi:NHLM bacteriocin system ABC transporter ATP-binding protein [Labrenzia sp. EL_208]|nr:NHLM bacteriocin system ABC transporter ATP-binding protein [Labrenzia sp. EL_132]MBG6230853.1 NHLM bacteriocin system ABC transporter ATP-binding protein [Labrenzia sp. EL_208]